VVSKIADGSWLIADGNAEMWKCRDAGMLGWGVENKGCYGCLAGKMGRRRNTKGPFWRASE